MFFQPSSPVQVVVELTREGKFFFFFLKQNEGTRHQRHTHTHLEFPPIVPRSLPGLPGLPGYQELPLKEPENCFVFPFEQGNVQVPAQGEGAPGRQARGTCRVMCVRVRVCSAIMCASTVQVMFLFQFSGFHGVQEGRRHIVISTHNRRRKIYTTPTGFRPMSVAGGGVQARGRCAMGREGQRMSVRA